MPADSEDDHRRGQRDHDIVGRGASTLHEQRRTFDRQVKKLSDIDDKALRTVRTAVIIIGFVVSAAGISSRLDSPLIGDSAAFTGALGIFFLAVTVYLGQATYAATRYKGRLSEAEFMDLVKPVPREGTERKTLRAMYRDWTRTAESRIEVNENSLAAVQISYLVAVVHLLTAGAWIVTPIRWFESIPPIVFNTSVAVWVGSRLLIPWVTLAAIILGARLINRIA